MQIKWSDEGEGFIQRSTEWQMLDIPEVFISCKSKNCPDHLGNITTQYYKSGNLITWSYTPEFSHTNFTAPILLMQILVGLASNVRI